MYTRDDNLYLKLLLQTMGCNNVTVANGIENSDDLICGLSHSSAMVWQDIARVLQPKRIYRAGPSSQYIAIFSKNQLIDFLESRFKTITQYLFPGCNGEYNREYGFEFYNEDFYLRFIGARGKPNPAIEKLREAGIDYGDYTEMIATSRLVFTPNVHYPFSSIYPRHSAFFIPEVQIEEKTHYWMRVCDVEKFFAKTLPIDVLERVQRESFIAGMASKASPLHFFKNDTIYDKNLTKLIFKFHAEIPSKQPIHIENCAPDKNTDAMGVKKLMNMMDLLASELKEEADSLKQDKLMFLKLVLALKKANTYFALSKCITIAQQIRPELYQQAIKGFFSRTQKILDEITYPLGKKRYKISL